MKSALLLLLLVSPLQAEEIRFDVDPYCRLTQAAVRTGLYSEAEIEKAVRSYRQDVNEIQSSFLNKKLSDQDLKVSVLLQTRVIRSQISSESAMVEFALSDALEQVSHLEKIVSQDPIPRASGIKLLTQASSALRKLQECIR